MHIKKKETIKTKNERCLLFLHVFLARKLFFEKLFRNYDKDELCFYVVDLQKSGIAPQFRINFQPLKSADFPSGLHTVTNDALSLLL